MRFRLVLVVQFLRHCGFGDLTSECIQFIVREALHEDSVHRGQLELFHAGGDRAVADTANVVSLSALCNAIRTCLSLRHVAQTSVLTYLQFTNAVALVCAVRGDTMWVCRGREHSGIALIHGDCDFSWRG